MGKFKIGDVVQTNKAYCMGFNQDYPAPTSIKRKNNLTVVAVGTVDTDDKACLGEFADNTIYTCANRSGVELIINECFLEEIEGEVR